MALLPVEEAKGRILRNTKLLPSEKIVLEQARGRILAKAVYAKRSQPPFAASAMDGYAVRAADLSTVPCNLRIIGTSAAGHGFKGQVKAGCAVRILTGAPLPRGADTVIIQENAVRRAEMIEIVESAPLGKNIRRAGLDFNRGDLLVPAGSQLSPRDIGLLAAGNAAEVWVRKRARIVLFTTGDELVLPGMRPRADQIVSSNSHALAAMAQQFGAEIINLGIVRDKLSATIAAVKKGLNADIILTTGGASVGDHDYVQAAFRACGIKIDFWKIALRPGKPFMYGRKGKTHVMGLPGNPVSALVTARIFLVPLLRAMAGHAPDETLTTAKLSGTLPANDMRRDYMRAELETAADGTRHVRMFQAQDSSMQRLLQSSQALIIREPFAPAASDGDSVSVLLLDF